MSISVDGVDMDIRIHTVFECIKNVNVQCYKKSVQFWGKIFRSNITQNVSFLQLKVATMLNRK